MTSFVRVNVLVEGPTEETFVRDVLGVSLAEKGVFLQARSVETKRSARAIYRGGLSGYEKAKRDLQRWLAQDQNAYTTTMFDLYALPRDFPGCERAQAISDPLQKVAEVERCFESDVSDRRFVAYIQLYEFEALLFSDVTAIDTVLRASRSSSRLRDLQKIRESVRSPEEIDDGPETAPSKHLKRLYPGYDKVVFGSLIASRIGLDAVRKACTHFNYWLERLEKLAGQ